MNKNKGYLMILGTAFISGFAIFVSKFGVSVINPYIYTFLKNAVVALFLCAAIFTIKDLKIFRSLRIKQWVLLVAIGILGGGIPFLLFFKGLSLTSPAGASFMHKTMFLWIFILAAIFLKEKITKKHFIIGTFILAGNAMILKIAAVKFDIGIFLVFIATFFWATENTISKYILRELPPRIVMWSRMFFGSIFILVFLISSGQSVLLSELNIQQISWAVVAGIILLGYVSTWYTGLKYVKLSDAAIILMLGSPITTYLSAISGKPTDILQYIGTLLVVFGVVFLVWTNGGIDRKNKLQAN